jgi:adenosylcobinamide-GDP ribazoletransferase
MRTFVAAVRFLTRLPMPGPATEARDLPGSLAWFPLVGALCHAGIAGAFLLAALWWPPAVAGILAVAAGLLLTGGFHEDAASDAADGLGGGTSNAKVLEIMRDSRIGAFGAMSLWVVLALRWALLVQLAALPPWAFVAAIALAGAWGRWTAAPLIAILPPLSEGLSKDIGGRATWVVPVVATALVGALSCAAWRLEAPHVAIAAAVAVVLTALWALYLRRRLGGQSGDLLGAGNVLVELGVLLAVAAA